MIQTIIFSKNRAAQLDLLLGSIANHTLYLMNPIKILWAATNQEYEQGYRILRHERRFASFTKERDFKSQLIGLMHCQCSDSVMFLCDDDIVTGYGGSPTPNEMLERSPRMLAFSLRLGLNTDWCYPMDCPQSLPRNLYHEGKILYWSWQEADSDFGYPMSLDGHVFRRSDILPMIQHLHYNSPNTLEDALVQATRSHSKGLLGCYEQSIVTGNPVNLVNDTHGNRHGRFHFRSSEELNDLYLKGERLSIPPIDPKTINAAHYEFELGV